MRRCCCVSRWLPFWPARSSRRPTRRRWLRERRAVFATIVVVAAVLLTAPLLLTMQFAALSNRPEVPLDRALEASLYPANLASMAVANVMGSLESTQTYWGPNFETLPEVRATDRSFNYLFVGVTTVIVLLWFGIAGGWAPAPRPRLLTGVLVVALLYMLAATPRSMRWHSTMFRASICSGGRWTGRSCSWPRSPFSPVTCWRTTCVKGYRGEALWRPLLLPLERLRHGLGGGVLCQVGSRWIRCGRWSRRPDRPGRDRGLWWAARSPRARIAAASWSQRWLQRELVWWNAASSLNAEPPAYYSALERPMGDEAAALAVLEREIDARMHKAKGRAWKSSA